MKSVSSSVRHPARIALVLAFLAGALTGNATPAAALAPSVQQYVHGIEALRALQTVPPEEQDAYRKEHAEELDEAARTVTEAADFLAYTLAFNAAIIHKYGHAVICNYDEEIGPKVEKLVDNHIQRLVAQNIPLNQAKRATMELFVDELVLGEMLDEFSCP